MGSRGSFLESGGFSTPAKWRTVDYVEGVKVPEPKDTRANRNLPDRSNTPGTSYLKLNHDGSFSQLRIFGEDRLPICDIDYGVHQAKTFLHMHYFMNGNRTQRTVALNPGDTLYEKYKQLFRGVN